MKGIYAYNVRMMLGNENKNEIKNETPNKKPPTPFEVLEALNQSLKFTMADRVRKAQSEADMLTRLMRHSDVLDAIFLQMAAVGSRREEPREIFAALRAQNQHLYTVREFTRLMRGNDGTSQPKKS